MWIVLPILIGVRDGGDWIGSQDGHRLGTSRWVWTRRARVVSLFAWARIGLTRRPAAFLMSAKFVLVAHGACGGDDDGRGVNTGACSSLSHRGPRPYRAHGVRPVGVGVVYRRVSSIIRLLWVL